MGYVANDEIDTGASVYGRADGPLVPVSFRRSSTSDSLVIITYTRNGCTNQHCR